MTVNYEKNQPFSSYESEYMDTLRTLFNENSQIEELRYFLNTIYRYFKPDNMKKRQPQVIVLGSSIPEELIYAAGAKPFWILGGSLGTVAWSDDLVPRDTDPVSRSVLGFLLNEHFDLAEEALIIVPITCDSSRKMAYLLSKAGKKVVTVDIPPEKGDPLASLKWRSQMENLSDKLSDHTGQRLTKKKLTQATQLVEGARKLMRDFIQVCQEKDGLISGALRMAILNSYYYSTDLKSWCSHLRKLNLELLESRQVIYEKEKNKPQILLIGSPVYLPNYKIPFLIGDIGLQIGAALDSSTQKIYASSSQHKAGKRDPFTAIIETHYRYDCSSAYAKNDMLYQSALWHLKQGRIEGVVFHVLKGQIEYDFELERFEQLFGTANIPVFRLETDYQYQDVEQLRIRMEAFMEMLAHHRYREEKRAV
ncbi:2-hydroxyacyl-CoA dehydratase family protein [Acetobacterium wieringae]|uniref:2-hydroxyacyl-CoA dehydratase family protein n=1 Tax=Acetobacterium wieringae TaxID=52694 RepID=UPI0026ED0086|nr:2-hydroxyacyl-CoA dehydratase family protein [Acetobacterium wieringae]